MTRHWNYIAPILLAVASMAGAPQTHAADDLAARLKACRAIAETTARAQCYDRVVDGETPPLPQRGAQVQAPPAPAAPPPPPAAPRPAAAVPAKPESPAARFGEDALPRAQRPAAENPEPDAITAKVVAISTDGYGKGIVTLDNGQVWRQIEGERMRLKAGDGVAIKRGVLGNYLLIPAGLNRSYRVMRAQ